VANEGQPPPTNGEDIPEKQAYYGWQYAQDDGKQAQLPVPPPPGFSVVPPSQPMSPAGPPPIAPGRGGYQPQLHPQYQEPIQDMGTSLGYGQGMEYQYSDAPQPSQPIAQLRQERFQMLREERMRRQQRRIGRPDITSLLPWSSKRSKQPVQAPMNAAMSPSAPAPVPPVTWRSNVPSSVPFQESPEQLSPPLEQISPSLQPPARLQSQGVPAPGDLQSAAAPAQDTSMIQRVHIGRATRILTIAFIASRVLGLVRTSMFAFVFGTSPISDAYLQAFLVPDLIFNIVAGGALSSAFIPVFTKYMVGDKDERTAWSIASSALNLAIVIMMVLALIAIIFARLLVPIYNPGVHDVAKLDLIASLTRVMLLQSVLLGGGVIVTAVLNARQNFLLPAVGTVIYNVGLIMGLLPGLYLAIRGQRNDTLAIYGATWGVVLGALFQVGFQIPGLRKVGMHYNYKAFDWHHPGVIQIGRQMVPRIINAAMLYSSTFVDRGLILLLVVVVGNGIDGLITQYYQAFQLVLLPLGVFGMAVSTAAFPTLAENVAKGRIDRVCNTIMETLRSIIFMSIPSSVGLIVLGFPIIQVLLQHGRFNLAMAQSTAVPLAFFAIGLAGLASVEILTRSFYALRDSTTPVIVSVGQFVFKIALSLAIIDVAIWGARWGMGALAFATSFAGLLEAVVLYWLLHLRVGLPIKEICAFIGRVALAALAMGLALLVARFLLDHIPFLDTTRTPALGLGGTIAALLKLLIELFVGAFVYIRGSRMLGIEELGPVKRVLDRLKLSWI